MSDFYEFLETEKGFSKEQIESLSDNELSKFMEEFMKEGKDSENKSKE